MMIAKQMLKAANAAAPHDGLRREAVRQRIIKTAARVNQGTGKVFRQARDHSPLMQSHGCDGHGTENAMITRNQSMRRRTTGTIDIDLYRQQALTERAAVTLSRNKRRPARPFMAAATIAGPASALIVISLAVAGMAHVAGGAPSTVAAASAHFDR